MLQLGTLIESELYTNKSFDTVLFLKLTCKNFFMNLQQITNNITDNIAGACSRYMDNFDCTNMHLHCCEIIHNGKKLCHSFKYYNENDIIMKKYILCFALIALNCP